MVSDPLKRHIRLQELRKSLIKHDCPKTLINVVTSKAKAIPRVELLFKIR